MWEHNGFKGKNLTMTMHGGRDRDIFGGSEDSARVEVSDDQLQYRYREWIELITTHPGELILSYEHNPDIHRLTVIRDDITVDDTLAAQEDYFKGLLVSQGPVVWIKHSQLTVNDEMPIRVNLMNAYESFQTCNNNRTIRTEPAPKFELVVGNKAVADRLSKGDSKRHPYQYYDACRKLGIEPIMTPEVQVSIDTHKQRLITGLLKTAIEQRALNGHKFISPGDRVEKERITRQITEMKGELMSFGIDEAQFYFEIATMLGLDLIKSEE